MSESFFTVAQAAKQLGLHPKTVLRLLHEQRLRGARIGKSYRILQSDLFAFAGGAVERKPDAGQVRVSCAVDAPDLSSAESGRLAAMLNAWLTGAQARPDPIHLSTIYDPQLRCLKLVLIGTPLDVAAVLKALDAFLGALR